jgi:HAD superfamily hydrolase (TIGR01509 family)
MQLNTVIFDMDGLLIDSEPLWNEAAKEVLKLYGVTLTEEQYNLTTGLRTKECLEWWLAHFNFDSDELAAAEKNILDRVTDKIQNKANVMPGVSHIISFFHERNFKIGIASSSPLQLIDLVMEICGIKNYIHATSSAELLDYGKPHPEVYLNCAENLEVSPLNCICFEDSFNGLIAAKAARMKCVVVPHHNQQKEERWIISDLKLSSLQNFGALHLNLLQ